MLIAHNKKDAGIALTFDDGPNPEHMPAVLDLMDELEVKANFFVVGKSMEEHPDLAEDIHKRGHLLCNHSYTHPHMTQLTLDEQREEIEKTSAVIKSITGENPKWFRPPYFDYDNPLLELVTSLGMISVHASISSRDAGGKKDITGSEVLQNLTDTLCADGIILCHFWSKASCEALVKFVPLAREKYEFALLQ